MDDSEILDELVENFYRGWEVRPTGGGFLIVTDWRLPGDERIEIHLRRVGDREDLFLVTDGGELINFLFSHGVDIDKDRESRRLLDGIAEKHAIKVADFQFVKGAGETEVAEAVRAMLEAVKEASFLLWHKIKSKPDDSVH
ncbi:MAG: hypothetical protein WAW37_12905 [Syntrophobacteraceae bacterium]